MSTIDTATKFNYTGEHTNEQIAESTEILSWIRSASICKCKPESERHGLDAVLLHACHDVAEKRYRTWLISQLPKGMSIMLEEGNVYISIDDESVMTEENGRKFKKLTERLHAAGVESIEFIRGIGTLETTDGYGETFTGYLVANKDEKVIYSVLGNEGEIEELTREGQFARMWKKLSRANASNL